MKSEADTEKSQRQEPRGVRLIRNHHPRMHCNDEATQKIRPLFQDFPLESIFFKDMFNYLRITVVGAAVSIRKKRKRVCVYQYFICWFSAQIATMAKGRGRLKLGTNLSRSPMGVAGAQALQPSSSAFPGPITTRQIGSTAADKLEPGAHMGCCSQRLLLNPLHHNTNLTYYNIHIFSLYKIDRCHLH